MNNNFANLFSLDGALRALGYIRNRRGTWANRPSTPPNYTPYYATDIGEKGTQLIYFGSRWYVQNGSGSLKTLGAAVTGIANSETIVLQTLIPAGAWQTNDTVRLWFGVTKSGTTDTAIYSIRVGTAGTTADTAITGYSAGTLLIAANRTYSNAADIKLVAATSAVKPASGFPTTGAGNTAESAATVISDVSANPIYVSLTIRSSGTTDTVGITTGSIQLLTP